MLKEIMKSSVVIQTEYAYGSKPVEAVVACLGRIDGTKQMSEILAFAYLRGGFTNE